jgi:hypothetical protein
MLAIPESSCAGVRARLQKGVSVDQSPSQLARALIAVRNVELMQHVEGPLFDSRAKASGWVDQMGPHLAGAARRPRGGRGKRVLALAYASADAPPWSPTLSAIADFLERALGAALVACPTPPAGRFDGADDVLRWLAVGGLAAALAAEVAPFFFGATATAPAAESRPAGAGERVQGVRQSTSVEGGPEPDRTESSSSGPSLIASDLSEPAPEAAAPAKLNPARSLTSKDASANTAAAPRSSRRP